MIDQFRLLVYHGRFILTTNRYQFIHIGRGKFHTQFFKGNDLGMIIGQMTFKNLTNARNTDTKGKQMLTSNIIIILAGCKFIVLADFIFSPNGFTQKFTSSISFFQHPPMARPILSCLFKRPQLGKWQTERISRNFPRELHYLTNLVLLDFLTVS